jgi:hypothetical protein
MHIFFSKDLNLSPFDFRAVLMKKPTLTMRRLSLFADKAGFPALSVETNIFGYVTIRANWLSFEMILHFQNKSYYDIESNEISQIK